MNFKEAMEHYRAGTASPEQRALVEAELEKSRLISEYLDEGWNEPIPIPAAIDEEIKRVRKTLRRRNALIVLTSLILAAALLLGTVYIGIPGLEKQYWDPSTASYGDPYPTDLELMLSAYAELFCPDINIAGANATKTGFAAYDISIQYWNAYRGGKTLYATASLEKGVLKLPTGFIGFCPVNIFTRATYPFYPAEEAHNQAVYERLSALPDYVTVMAAVSFPEDKNMEEVLAFQDSLIDGQIGWTAIRNGPLNEQILPHCGMQIFQWGNIHPDANEEYPCLDSKSVKTTPENLEAHFKSLLRFSADQVKNGTGIPEEHRKGKCFYTEVLNYVEENGVYSYGCYVRATPETFLALLSSGAVSQVWIEDIWISP